MKSIELQLYKLLKTGGVEEPQAKEIAELIENAVSHESLEETFVRKDAGLVTKGDLSAFREEMRVDMATIKSQMKTLQMLFGAVGIPILIAIFLQFFQ